MKDFLKEDLYWIIIAIAFALMFWLAPKVSATPLSDFLEKEKLDFPQVVLDQAKEQNLVAAAGTMNEEDKIFTVYFMRKTDLPANAMQTIDFDKAIMECKFYLSKKKITVEYESWRNSQPAKIWPSYRVEYMRVLLELWPL